MLLYLVSLFPSSKHITVSYNFAIEESIVTFNLSLEMEVVIGEILSEFISKFIRYVDLRSSVTDE